MYKLLCETLFRHHARLLVPPVKQTKVAHFAKKKKKKTTTSSHEVAFD